MAGRRDRTAGAASRHQQSLRPAPTRSGRWAVGAALLLAVMTVIVYVPAIRGQFIWDDDDYVQNNLTLRSAEGLWRIWFQVGVTPQYYPLVHTSYWIEYHLWGLNPAGYHVINILLHALGAILLWRVLAMLKVPGAWLASAVFALHPVQVESVAWITERKNVLSGVFYFTSALAYLRFVLADDGGGSLRRKHLHYGLSLAFFLCALFSKTVTASLPAALLLGLWWKRGRIRWRDVAPLIPFLVLGLGFGMLTAYMEKHRVGAVGEDWNLSPIQRGLIAGRVIWFYASNLVFPAQLAFIYPRWKIDPAVWQQYLFPLTAVAVLMLLWFGRRRLGRGPLAAALFFGGTLFPALGFFNVYPMRYSFVADHFQYLAAVGLIVLGVACARRLIHTLGLGRRTAGTAAAIILTVLSVLTWRQTRIYSDLETLWTDTLRRNPEAWMAHNNLANLLREKGDVSGATEHLQKAVTHFLEAVRRNPRDPVPHNDLSLILLGLGRIEEALDQCRRALELRPDYPEAHRNLGLILVTSGRVPEAIEHFRASLRLKPDNAAILNNLAWLLATSPQTDASGTQEAVVLAERAARLADHQEEAHVFDTLAAAYAAAGQFDKAVIVANRAIASASASGDVTVAAAIRKRLELYRQNRAYREPMPASGPNP